jgi:hypothetical protein
MPSSSAGGGGGGRAGARGSRDGLEANARQTRTVRLSRPVVLELVYEVAEVRNGELLLHPDVYGLASPTLAREQALQALVKAGHAAENVDTSRLAELVRESRRSRVAVPLSELLAD